ncbi:hypothetical protein OPW04_13460 [Vibrio europaeus]|nr:hypothetical protein [Vibrio europaeus]MDC5805861.1 hypothetical protein [Vibrio europaeus]MDC5831430.1 hypothetical protein [Vibrio europaeus]MDC5857028.1 hypothetical protein [Vibrio europaeus]
MMKRDKLESQLSVYYRSKLEEGASFIERLALVNLLQLMNW